MAVHDTLETRNTSVDDVRTLKVPSINVNAQDYTNLINWLEDEIYNLTCMFCEVKCLSAVGPAVSAFVTSEHAIKRLFYSGYSMEMIVLNVHSVYPNVAWWHESKLPDQIILKPPDAVGVADIGAALQDRVEFDLLTNAGLGFLEDKLCSGGGLQYGETCFQEIVEFMERFILKYNMRQRHGAAAYLSLTHSFQHLDLQKTTKEIPVEHTSTFLYQVWSCLFLCFSPTWRNGRLVFCIDKENNLFVSPQTLLEDILHLTTAATEDTAVLVTFGQWETYGDGLGMKVLYII
uniref:Uncharacterized protein n=1 Tax=Timema monikensis TaxID=170555 RepID=A0A7R9EIR4_9NEOP|nr:unnamed protein product [Timema monikensis]